MFLFLNGISPGFFHRPHHTRLFLSSTERGIRRLRGSELEAIRNVSDVEGIILFTKRRRDRAKKMGEKGRARSISGFEN